MQIDNKIGVRRFGLVNWIGVATLVKREIMRFLAVWNQTIAAPMVTSGLFLLIFNIAVGPNRGLVMGYSYIIFMVPGIVMMSIIQNAFANTSSSIMTSKIQGNIVDTLMPPLSAGEMLAGYVLGGIARGLFVAIGLWVGCAFVLGIKVAHPLLALAFTISGAGFWHPWDCLRVFMRRNTIRCRRLQISLSPHWLFCRAVFIRSLPCPKFCKKSPYSIQFFT